MQGINPTINANLFFCLYSVIIAIINPININIKNNGKIRHILNIPNEREINGKIIIPIIPMHDKIIDK